MAWGWFARTAISLPVQVYGTTAAGPSSADDDEIGAVEQDLRRLTQATQNDCAT